MISLAEQLREVEREIAMRRGFYARRVKNGQMLQSDADRGIALMEAVHLTVMTFAEMAEKAGQTRNFDEAMTKILGGAP